MDATSTPGPGTPASAPPAGETTRLTILYDERCAFCLRCRDWLASQPCLVEVDLLPAGSPEARARYGTVPGIGRELVVGDEHGRIWVGPPAFIVCLWATARYRAWAFRLSQRGWSRHAERFFARVSKRRGILTVARAPADDGCYWCDDRPEVTA